MKIIAAALLVLAGSLRALPAQEPPRPPGPGVDRPGHLPRLFLDDAVDCVTAPFHWDASDWNTLGLAALALGGAGLLLDRPLHDAALRNRRPSWDTAAKRIQMLGSNGALIIAGGLYLGGWAAGSPVVQATGTDALGASLVAGLILGPTLKFAAGRARPFQDRGPASFEPFRGWASFPSGHTTEAFALASVVSAHAPEPWVQAAAYGLASLVGAARIEQNAHWTSDVVAGALLGTFTGRAVVRWNEGRRETAQGGLEITVAPDLSLGGAGLQVRAVF